MKAEDLLLLGGVGVVAYLIYQTASTGAAVIPNLFSSVASDVQAAAGAVQTGWQTVAAVPSVLGCGDAALASYMPLGTGALSVPDSYLVPCSGGVTAGILRNSGLSDAEVINYIAGLECACAKAKLPGSGLSVQNNVIVPNPGVGGYRLPAGVVRV